MIDELYYDNAAETLVELWGEVETELIEEISRRIKKTMTVTETAKFELEKLQQANLLNEHAVKLISEKSGLSESEIRRLITDAGYGIVMQDEAIYRQALESGQLTIEPLPIAMSPRLKTAINACIANAEFGLSNLTNTRMMDAGNGMETLTKAARREYYNAVNKAFLQVRTGAKTTPRAVRDSCIEFARKGIQITHWKSGHVDTLEVAVRRNICTSMGQTSAQMTLARMEDYVYDLVEVSSHFGARPSHFLWQGKIFSLSGKSYYYYKQQCESLGIQWIDLEYWGGDFYSVTGYGTGPGLCGWNCRHRFHPYFPGINPVYPKYDEDKNRKQYEDTQQQRALERAIRTAKHEKAALMGADASEEEIRAANANIRAKQKDLKEYMDKHKNLDRDYSREAVYDKNGAVTAKGGTSGVKPTAGHSTPKSGTAGNKNGTNGSTAVVSVAGGSNGGTGKTYTGQKIPQRGLTSSGGGGTIREKEKFNTQNDPMREVFGSAEISNPEEIKAIEKHFADIGVELIREEKEKLCYSPGLSIGQRGTVYISKGASYSAWLHEQKHVDDDMSDGWLGMHVFADPEKCAKREIDAYEIEIAIAKKANRSDIVKRLEVLRDDEIERYH